MAFGARSEQAVVTPLVLLLFSLPGLAVLPGPVLPFLLTLLLQSAVTVGIYGVVRCRCLEMPTVPRSVISKGMQAEPGLGCSCTARPPAVPFLRFPGRTPLLPRASEPPLTIYSS